MNVVLRPSFIEAGFEQVLHEAAEFDFAETEVAVLVAQDVAIALDLAFGQRLDQGLFAHRFNQPLGEDDDAVLGAFGAAFDDGADDDVAKVVHASPGACEIPRG